MSTAREGVGGCGRYVCVDKVDDDYSDDGITVDNTSEVDIEVEAYGGVLRSGRICRSLKLNCYVYHPSGVWPSLQTREATTTSG